MITSAGVLVSAAVLNQPAETRSAVSPNPDPPKVPESRPLL